MELYPYISLGTVVSFVIVATLVLLLFVHGIQKHYTNLPPGPIGYPFIGNILDLHPSKIVQNFRQFRRKYGDIFSIRMGMNQTVVVSGYDNLKELFGRKGDSVSARPMNFVFKDLYEGIGIVSSSGSLWKIHRTFAQKILRGPGFGEKSMESKILEEVDVLLTEIEGHDRKSFNLDKLVYVSVSNIICSITLGQRFDHRDKRFKTLLFLVEDILQTSGISVPISVFPFLKYLPGDLFAAKRLLKNIKEISDFVQHFINEHKLSFDPDNIRDYIDAYLKEKTDRNRLERETFTDKQLMRSLTDLFIAGTESTTTSLQWFISYLLNYPDVQTKMAQELKSVVGPTNLPSLKDKANLPYCEAVMTEVLRCSNIAPFSGMHSACEDVQMTGFNIPKGTIIIQSLDSVLKDPELFPDPEQFRPSRFIDDNGKFCGHDKVIPFSVGRRVCVGESLARKELFLISTSLVHNFEFLLPEGKSAPPLKGILGIVHKSNPYEIRAVKRH